MRVLCTICKDDLHGTPANSPSHDDYNTGKLSVIALKCGHMFHRVCIEQDFNSHRGTANINAGSGECPICQRRFRFPEAVPVLPCYFAWLHEDLQKLESENTRLHDKLREQDVLRRVNEKLQGIVQKVESEKKTLQQILKDQDNLRSLLNVILERTDKSSSVLLQRIDEVRKTDEKILERTEETKQELLRNVDDVRKSNKKILEGADKTKWDILQKVDRRLVQISERVEEEASGLLQRMEEDTEDILSQFDNLKEQNRYVGNVIVQRLAEHFGGGDVEGDKPEEYFHAFDKHDRNPKDEQNEENMSQSEKEAVAHLLREQVHSAAPGTPLTNGLREKLNSLPENVRKEIVSMTDEHDAFNRAPLFIAIQNENLEIAKYLIETCNADLEQWGRFRYTDGRMHEGTSLFMASRFRKLPLVKFLLQNGALVDGVSEYGQTPVFASCLLGHEEMVRYFVEEAGANISIPSAKRANTCLHISLKKGHTALAEYLLVRGAPVNVQNCDLESPLHLAVRSGYVKLTRDLLSRGADPLLKDKDGNDALELARLHNQTEIYDILWAVLNPVQEPPSNNSKAALRRETRPSRKKDQSEASDDKQEECCCSCCCCIC